VFAAASNQPGFRRIWTGTRLVLSGALFIAAGCGPTAAAAEPGIDGRGLEFFEKKIRPVLHEHCYACHSAESDEIGGGLLLDTRDGARLGGDHGATVIPYNPQGSLLLSAIAHRDETLQMPPGEKLPDAVVADFRRWIELGAPDPREKRSTGGGDASSVDWDEARQFWAFQPLQNAAPPNLQDSAWSQHPVDRFILARLEAEGLSPAADASGEVLLRRLYFDLVGLPPTPEAIRQFAEDRSAGAVEKVVDGLLATAQFGEKWGRHWLDVARYADSNGGDINLTFRNAWRYRDYVIRSVNRDKPWRQFIREQIAGDLLPFDADRQRAEQLTATGFLIVGPKMLSERDKEKLRMDVVDEQIDTIGRAFLGLTLGCARCHDHKFDPVPTTDYYALAGIFRSTETVHGIRMNNVNVSGWLERPLPEPPQAVRRREQHKSQVAQLSKALDAAKKKLEKLNSQSGEHGLPGIVVDDAQAKLVGDWKKSTYSGKWVGAGYLHDDRSDKGAKSVTFTPDLPLAGYYEVRISYSGGGGRHPSVPVTLIAAEGERKLSVDQARQPPIDGLFASLGKFQFAAGRGNSLTIGTSGTEGKHVIADAVQFLPAEAELAEKLRQLRDEPAEDQGQADLDVARRRVDALRKQIERLKKDTPPEAPQAMAAADREEAGDWHICIRGQPRQLGAKVRRGFLGVFPSGETTVSPGESGRRELAEWIVGDASPLSSRILVNRVWQQLFGQGIVASSDNFGQLGQRPTHPALLDWLAIRFQRDHWSLKRLVRQLVLSRSYQMSTKHSERAAEIDPANGLLWRQRRRRLSAEAIRDSMLAAAGKLDLRAGGSAVADLGESAISNSKSQSGGVETAEDRRRSVYLPVVRNDVPAMLEIFNFADPDVVTGQRTATNVPDQALLLINSSFVRRQAATTAQRVVAKSGDDPRAAVDRLYLTVLGRLPDARQRDRALAYLRQASGSEALEASAWAELAQVLFASTEFRFLD